MADNDNDNETATPRLRRRRLLAALGLGGAAAAGAVGVPRLVDAAGGSTANAASAPSATLHLTGADLRASTGASPGELPAGRVVASTSGRLVAADGSDVGSFRSSPLNHADGTALHTFELADGTILGMGAGPLAEATFAIVGGTGAYAGTTGAYVARLSPKGAGGDGSGEFTMNLRPGS